MTLMCDLIFAIVKFILINMVTQNQIMVGKLTILNLLQKGEEMK